VVDRRNCIARNVRQDSAEKVPIIVIERTGKKSIKNLGIEWGNHRAKGDQMNAILLLALWLQMSAPTTGISHLGSMTVDHGKVLSTQIACIKTYADGFIEYNPCEISTPPTTNFVQPASVGKVTASAEELKREAQRAADETDGKPPSNSKNPKICEVRQVYKEGDIEDVTLSCIPDLLAEPVDVPAVQKTQKVIVDCAAFYNGDCVKPKTTRKLVTTCADKSRILEHDENSPPKYWCRKVEF
jgi:hypothetical protein